MTGTDGKKYLMTPDDWANTLYNKSLRQEYNVSANGGTDRSTYYTSVGYLKMTESSSKVVMSDSLHV